MESVDVFVIGGGGTGSEVAFSLARSSGSTIALAERDKLGGECNHYGCVPTKVMLRSAKIAALARDAARIGLRIPEVSVDFQAVRDRVRGVIEAQSGEGAAPFERAGVRVFLQEARLTGERRVELADGSVIEAGKVVLATGTEAAVPPIPGIEDGPFWTNREAIWKPDAPPRSLAVIGTGAVGIEFAQIYARFGSRVTALEALPHILPQEDEEAAASILPALEADGIAVLPDARIERAQHDGDRWTLTIADGEPVVADELLVATGRSPMFEPHDLAAAGIELDRDGNPVLTDTLRTHNPDVWVAGDATGDLLFTHVGSYEAELVVKDILGHPEAREYRVVPRVTFCDPEVASVGLTERQARDEGRDGITSVRWFRDNERSHIDGSTEGLVKLVAERGTGELLGGHIVGEEAGALIHQIVLMMTARTTAPAVAAAIHAYPTLSESVKSALLGIEEQVGVALEVMDTPVAEVISVTDKAARRIAALALKEGHAMPVLRVRVTAGGCSGFTYDLSFADGPADDDAVIEAADGVRVLVDPVSAPIVRGSTLEFNDALLGGGLRMLNPQATHECACGDSFSI